MSAKCKRTSSNCIEVENDGKKLKYHSEITQNKKSAKDLVKGPKSAEYFNGVSVGSPLPSLYIQDMVYSLLNIYNRSRNQPKWQRLV